MAQPFFSLQGALQPALLAVAFAPGHAVELCTSLLQSVARAACSNPAVHVCSWLSRAVPPNLAVVPFAAVTLFCVCRHAAPTACAVGNSTLVSLRECVLSASER